MVKNNNNILLLGGIVVLAIFIFRSGGLSTQALISGPNLIVNPGFEESNNNWYLRDGQGPAGTDVAKIDTSVFHSGSASVRLDPCNEGGCDGDRAIWQNNMPSVTAGVTYKLSGWIRHGVCSGASQAVGDECYVDPAYSGWVGAPPNYGNNICWFDNWCRSGGARLGLDYYDSSMTSIGSFPDEERFLMMIADWNSASNVWHYVEVIDVAPPGAAYVNVWMQGHEHYAPASVWLDDVSLTTYEDTGCDPTTCVQLSYECGIHDDGCGGTLNCGSCSVGDTCVNGVCESGPFVCDIDSNGIIDRDELGSVGMKWING